MAERVSGEVRGGFEAVREVFAEATAARPGVNAAVAAHVGGERVVDLWTGPDYGPDSLQGVYSVTKGVAGVVVALLVERGLLDLDRPVADYWPEFARAGKERVTVRTLAGHRAGLLNVDGGFTSEELIGHTRLAERLAAQAPMWEPGTRHGYHGLTIGTLVDELVRRVTGTPLGEYYHREIAGPYGADFFIGLPESEEPRVVLPKPLFFGGDRGVPDFMPELFAVAMNLGRRTGEGDLPARRDFRAAGVPSIGGFGSARGVAAVYAAALGGLLSPETIREVSAVVSDGEDAVIGFPTRYGTVFELSPAGRPAAFGHAGAAGALGYADPQTGVAFGFTTDTPSFPGPADPVTLDLTKAIVAAL
ncbi:serine hydrolase domain-containing protein [Actinomadura kijaniata]|uniref:serine hydrolase domain-containing protein n=1 Tax=Actinomadura kijaniata TaxID=46161 RepID=UPI003F1C2C89